MPAFPFAAFPFLGASSMSPMVNVTAPGGVDRRESPLHADLVAMLRATRNAERDLFGMLSPDVRDAVGTIGEWSAKDVLAHIAAWRAIEARRLEARAGVSDPEHAADPEVDDPIDGSNAQIHAQHANLPWSVVERKADTSLEALIAAFGRSSSDILCECPDGIVAGNGANAANHAMAHLSDIAQLGGGHRRYDAFAREIESILRRGHLPSRDSGVMLYNLGCHRALAGELDEARRLLRAAFAHRHDLLEPARQDPDLAALSSELPALAAPA